MKIFVTGATGFLGSYLQPALTGHDVVSPERATLDITDAAATIAALERARPDVVIHLAALCGAIPSSKEPGAFFRTNAQGTVNVLEACRKAGVERFLFTSSMTVFGAGDEAKETDAPFAPRHPYAAAKAGAELAVRIYSRSYGLRSIILRPTLVVGERYKEPHAIGDFVETVRAGGTIDLFGEGGHRRDFVHPEDVARAMVAGVEWLAEAANGACESFNLSNGEAPRMLELADLVIATVGRGARRLVAPTAQTFSLFASNERIQSLLGIKPRVTNRQIIERLWSQGTT